MPSLGEPRVEPVAGEINRHVPQRPGDRDPLTDPVRFSRCDAGWSTSKTSTPASSFIRQARPSRPAPRMTSCGAGLARTASSIAIVRGTINSAHARTASKSTRWAQPAGGVSARTWSTGTSSSSTSIVIATGSANRPTAMRPSAAARPWQTRTAVRLASIAVMLAASRRSRFQLSARIDTGQPAELAESGQQESAFLAN